MIFMCFIRASVPPAPLPAVSEHFTKYAIAPSQSAASMAVETWCRRIGLEVNSIKVAQAGDQNLTNYDPATVIH